MKIVYIGGGPGWVILRHFGEAARRWPRHHRIERDPAGATYGWGVVYWDDLLDILFRNDLDSECNTRRIRAMAGAAG